MFQSCPVNTSTQRNSKILFTCSALMYGCLNFLFNFFFFFFSLSLSKYLLIPNYITLSHYLLFHFSVAGWMDGDYCRFRSRCPVQVGEACGGQDLPLVPGGRGSRGHHCQHQRGLGEPGAGDTRSDGVTRNCCCHWTPHRLIVETFHVYSRPCLPCCHITTNTTARLPPPPQGLRVIKQFSPLSRFVAWELHAVKSCFQMGMSMYLSSTGALVWWIHSCHSFSSIINIIIACHIVTLNQPIIAPPSSLSYSGSCSNYWRSVHGLLYIPSNAIYFYPPLSAPTVYSESRRVDKQTDI